MKIVVAAMIVIGAASLGMIMFDIVGLIGGLCLGGMAGLALLRTAEGTSASSSSNLTG